MGTMAPRPCKSPGCSGKVRGDRRYCDRHLDQEFEDARRRDGRRGTAASRGYGSRWQKERETFLALYPICADPYNLHPDVTVVATVVDHIEPHRGDESLFWNPKNWQSLCKPCHDFKTGRGL